MMFTYTCTTTLFFSRLLKKHAKIHTLFNVYICTSSVLESCATESQTHSVESRKSDHTLYSSLTVSRKENWWAYNKKREIHFFTFSRCSLTIFPTSRNGNLSFSLWNKRHLSFWSFSWREGSIILNTILKSVESKTPQKQKLIPCIVSDST